MDYKEINENFYSENYWGIDRSAYKWFSKYVKARVLAKFLEGCEHKEVLYDAGGGVGNWGSYFSKGFKKVIVSDISEKALTQIPEENIIKLNCNVLENKLPDESVDCVLLIDVFEHIDKKDLPKMMKDLRRILKPSGRILIFTSLFGWGLGLFTRRIFNQKKRLLKNEHLEGHVNRLKFEEFKELFKATDLEIDDYYFYSIIFQQLTDAIKDNFARMSSSILGKGKIDERLGRKGQSIKENLRKRESSAFLKMPLFMFSRFSYLDILLFGKSLPGNTIFFSLKKK